VTANEFSDDRTQSWVVLNRVTIYFYYLEIYQEHDQNIIRRMNVLLAIASSTSIGAWALWQQVPMVWASIVVASQIINAVSPWLPYKSREKALRDALPILSKLALDCEDLYQDASSPGNDVTDKVRACKRKLSDISSSLYESGLPNKPELFSRAIEQAHNQLSIYSN
jgi:hypothetical protein